MNEIEHGFVAWYSAAHPRLLSALAVRAESPEAAADAVAEACVRAYERWDHVGAMANPTGWTYTVAVNRLRRRWARVIRDRVITSGERPVPYEPVDPEAVALRDAVRALPERSRDLIVARYYLDLTESAVAEMFEIPRGTVASLLHSARRRLRLALGDADEDDSGHWASSGTGGTRDGE